jgi:hypothetical protein
MGGGGRYDNLIGTFGTPQPAVGVALGIDRLLNAQRSTRAIDASLSITPHLLVASSNSADALAIVSEWRSQGLRVVVNVDEAHGEELWRVAQQTGIALAASWTGQGFDLYGLTPEQPAKATFVPQDEAHQIAQHAVNAHACAIPAYAVLDEVRFQPDESSDQARNQAIEGVVRSEEQYASRS